MLTVTTSGFPFSLNQLRFLPRDDVLLVITLTVMYALILENIRCFSFSKVKHWLDRFGRFLPTGSAEHAQDLTLVSKPHGVRLYSIQVSAAVSTYNIPVHVVLE